MKIGLFGGSFDPFHEGHRRIARTALDELDLDRVVVLPTGRPPHKPDLELAPALARYAMAELALLDEPELVLSDLELAESTTSFTIDTVEGFREGHVGELFLVIGSDSLAELTGWRRWRDLLAEVELAVAQRPGSARERTLDQLPAELAERLDPSRVHWLAAPEHPASASEIRRRLAADEPVPDGWLDPRVLTFLRKYSLYR